MITTMSPEDQSFLNLVEFHREDLLKVLDGAHATKIFTEQFHSHLVKHGVLRRVPTMKRSLPTPEAMKVLRALVL